MAVTNKATPQLLRLQNIKTCNSDLIQRSNSLHSSNSIKRSRSQWRVAEANRFRGQQGLGDSQGEGSSQLHDALEQLQGYQEPEQQFTPAVMITGPSARSSAQSTVSNKRAPSLPSMVLEPRPLHPNYHTHPSPPSPVTPPAALSSGSGVQATIQHSASAPTALVSLLASTSTTMPTIPTSISSQSAPPSAMRAYPSMVQHQQQASTSHQGGPHLSQAATSPTRDSTFSTLSDARSTTTRGEGEEIMIFWDGHRGSRSSNL